MPDPRIVSVEDGDAYATIHYEFEGERGNIHVRSVIDISFYADELAGATPEGRLEVLRRGAEDSVDEVQASVLRNQAKADAMYAARDQT